MTGPAQAKLWRRLTTALGWPEALEALATRLSGSDFSSLLLEVLRRRSARTTIAELRARAETRLMRPSQVDARLALLLDQLAYAAAAEADFELVELSPVSPLGTHVVLGGIDQNNVLGGTRSAEVAADSTTALAFECARRRHGTVTVQLAASQRLVRLQHTDYPGYSPHFRLFALATAGRDEGHEAFATAALRRHLGVHLRLLGRAHQIGIEVRDLTVRVADTSLTRALLATHGIDARQLSVRSHNLDASEKWLSEHGIALPRNVTDVREALAPFPALVPMMVRLLHVQEEVFDLMREDFPEVRFTFDLGRLEGLGYYDGLCFHLDVTTRDGVTHAIGDGGLVDWTQRLLSSKKERFFASGLGTELLCRRFAEG